MLPPTASAAGALALIAPDAVAALAGTPHLRAAIHRHIAATFALVADLDAFGFWLSRNRDRVALAALIAALATRDIGVTGGEFVRLAEATGFASRAAAQDFLARARAAGHLTPLLPGRAAAQPVLLRRPLWQAIRRLVRHFYGALAVTWPDLAPIARGDRATLRALGQYLLMGLMWRNAARRTGRAPPFGPALLADYARVAPFLARDIGLRFLFVMIEQQPAGGAALLDRAPLSRRWLATRLGVSRIHINRLLDELVAAGRLDMPTADSLEFAPELSAAVEHLFAQAFQILRALAHAVQHGAPIDRAGLARIDRRLG
ncbi:hypothetical protein IP88_14010 [alpha proteobacterium AAP81b]|nr:hypothetical protein IP88_14010 [alpha proteobacterium AAP81b]